MVRPKSVGKAKRINITSKRKVFGRSPKELVAEFRNQLISGTNVRIYSVPGTNERFVLQSVSMGGTQDLFEVRTRGNAITFNHVGRFTGGFTHREITDATLKGKGLGTRTLKSERALARAKGHPQSPITTNQRSTLLLLLKNGYRINRAASAEAIKATGVKSEKALADFLKKKGTFDHIIEEFRLEKP